MNIPNYLTLIRIALVPVFVAVYYMPVEGHHLIAALVFAAAAITDWFDGYLARYLNQATRLGAFLDPVADKLMVAVALVVLVAEKEFTYLAIPACIIIGREIVISALREWMAQIGKRTSVAVSLIGKFKTMIQMFAVILLLATTDGVSFIGILSYWMIWIAAFLTLWSMIMYLRAAWSEIDWEVPSK